ncbi:hypothetical protein [Glutamicibacter soli]
MDLKQSLLAGRRGRRLLSSIVLSGTAPEAQHLMRSVFDASFELAQQRGDGVVRFTMAEESAGAEPQESAADETAPSIAQIAQMLRTVPLPEAMPELIRSALADSVDWAMYWQPPDAEDTLFGDPRLVQALERVAEHVASTGIIQSWMGASTQANQWMITWTGESAEGQWEPGLEPAQSQLKAWNLDLAEKERASKADLREKMDQLASGHWWSNPPGGLYRSFGTFELEEPIGLACVEDGMGWSSALVRRLQVECRKPVFHITEPRHWADLCRRYPLEVSATMRRNWFETTGRDGLWVQPDWQAVAEDYDGVHLGLGAYLAGAGEIIAVDARRASVIAGWNPDETYWFTDAVQPVDEVRTWGISDAGGRDVWLRR